MQVHGITHLLGVFINKYTIDRRAKNVFDAKTNIKRSARLIILGEICLSSREMHFFLTE